MPEIRSVLLVAACAIAACGPPAEPRVSRAPVVTATESFRDFGDYTVHFNAIRTSQLLPEIAREYGIVRSNNRAMLNLSVLEKEPESLGMPVRADIVVSATNLAGQPRAIDLREIREQAAIYYIAEFPIDNEETLTFSIDVTPFDQPTTFSLRYRKQFFTN